MRVDPLTDPPSRHLQFNAVVPAAADTTLAMPGSSGATTHITVIPAKAGTQARNLRAPSSQVVGAGLTLLLLLLLLLLPYAFDLPAT
ncbi:MAG TPA: hypothetical protein VGD42_05940 [Lysobacter sp.]